MTDLPILSLCLPTYKRAALLDPALRAVLGQITPQMAQTVEVIVLDNASPDETPQVVEKALADFPDVAVRYVRRPQNIGPDANFLDAVMQAQGEFVYLLSDDDVLLPGAVETLLALIAAHPDFDAFALNIRHFATDPAVDLAAVCIFQVKEDRIFRGRDAAVSFLKTHITFLSAMAFRRTNIGAINYTDKIGSIIIQAYFFLDALAPGRGLYLTHDAFLAQRTDNVGGYNFFEVFVTHFAQVLDYAARRGYTRRTIRAVQAQHLRLLFSFTLIFKVRGSYGQLRPNFHEGIARMWRAYGPNPYFLGVLLPLLLLPNPLVAGLRSVSRGLKSKILRRPLPPSLADPQQ